MSKGAIGLLSAYWPEGTARYAHIPLERVTTTCVHRPAAATSDAVALDGTQRVTYRALAGAVTAGAARLRERVPEGGRVAVVVADPVTQVLCLLACLDGDRLAYVAPGTEAGAADLAPFQPDLVVTQGALPDRTCIEPEELLAEGADSSVVGPRPNLRSPLLALPAPGSGEVLHSHRTLVATAISCSEFFMLEPGAEVVVLDPLDGWLTLAIVLATLRRGGVLRPGWGPGWTGHPERVDYVVARWETLEERHLGALPRLRDVHPGVGVLAGLSGPFSVGTRRRLGRRLGAPVLTVFGRNDLGPLLASHPTWFLDDAVGIPLPNVDVRPLSPLDGGELTIGWDVVEDAEMGVKSALAPAGGELSGEWLRSRSVAAVDPTGLYFLRRRPTGEADEHEPPAR
jgi:hypothetical protein